MTPSCWPTKNQELLLRACLLSGDEVLTAWRQWQSVFEEKTFDEGSRRLLPLLYRNLQNQKIAGASLARLKDEYFRTWSENQFYYKGIARLIDEFYQAGIQNILLKGSALALLYYEDVGLRPMKDIDILVPHDQAKRSIQLLTRLGWRPRYASPETLIPFEQATEFTGPANENLDLHWRLMWEGRQDLDDREFWEASVDSELNGTQIASLDSADQLLHVCVHGAKWNDTPSIRWVADAIMILRSKKFPVDWTRLVRQARERQLSLPMRETLNYLKNLLNADIPSNVLAELEQTRTTVLERWMYRTRLGKNESLKMLTVLWHWLNSLRLDCQGNVIQRVAQFSRYLQSLWSITRVWQVPFYLVGRPIRRVSYTIRSNLR